MLKALADNLIAAKGVIVNVSSQVGSIEVAHKIGRDISYTTSKAALNMITLKESQVLQSLGVTVISLHPGWIRSEMGGPSATLDPDVAATSIVDLVDGLTLDNTGSFYQWDGTIHPW
jgi:NAD(P)-dependent dehydrogenase (short-subunit alcohol dehydrogenase family)